MIKRYEKVGKDFVAVNQHDRVCGIVFFPVEKKRTTPNSPDPKSRTEPLNSRRKRKDVVN